MYKKAFLGVIFLSIILFIYRSNFFKITLSTSNANLNTSTNELDSFNVTLDNLLITGHPILSKSPFNQVSLDTLIASHDIKPKIQHFTHKGASDFYWSFYNFPGITYVTVNCKPNPNIHTTMHYFILTSDSYSLNNGLKVGMDKEEFCNQYPSATLITPPDTPDHNIFEFLGDIFTYDAVYSDLGMITENDYIKQGTTNDTPTATGIAVLFYNNKIIAILNILPGAN